MPAIGGEVLGATPRKPPIGRNRGRPRGVRFPPRRLLLIGQDIEMQDIIFTSQLYQDQDIEMQDMIFTSQLYPNHPRPPFPIGYD